MSNYYTTLGLFKNVETVVDAAEKVKEAHGVIADDITVITSAAYPDGILLEDPELEKNVNDRQVFFPFLLGCVGFVAGVTLAGGTGIIMNLDVGGKPPFTLPPTGIITYEFSLLFGVIGSVVSLFYYAGFPNWSKRAYDPEISDGALGLLAKFDSEDDQGSAASIMENHGAYKILKGENDF